MCTPPKSPILCSFQLFNIMVHAHTEMEAFIQMFLKIRLYHHILQKGCGYLLVFSVSSLLLLQQVVLQFPETARRGDHGIFKACYKTVYLCKHIKTNTSIECLLHLVTDQFMLKSKYIICMTTKTPKTSDAAKWFVNWTWNWMVAGSNTMSDRTWWAQHLVFKDHSIQ